MSSALRFEWVRLRTLRSTYWLFGSALVLNAVIAFLGALATRDDPLDGELAGLIVTAGGANVPLPLAGVFAAGVGILATGHEYRYGTIQPTLTAIPQRSTLLAAKVLVLGVTALVFATISLLVNLAAGMIFWGEVPDLTQPPLDGALPGYVALMALWTVLGVALGQLFRGVPSALVFVLVVPLIVEQVVFRLTYVDALDWLQPVVKFLPFIAGQQLTVLSGEIAGTDADGLGIFGRWGAGGVFAAFIAIILATAWTTLEKRDA